MKKKVMEQVEKMVMEDKHQMREYIPKDEVLDIIKSMPMDMVEEYVYELDGIWLVDDEEKIQLSPETSNDPISRQAAIEALCDQCGYYTDEQCKTDSGFWCESGARMRELPPVELPVCEDAISRQQAIEVISNCKGICDCYDDVKTLINNIPPVEPEPVSEDWISRDGLLFALEPMMKDWDGMKTVKLIIETIPSVTPAESEEV